MLPGDYIALKLTGETPLYHRTQDYQKEFSGISPTQSVSQRLTDYFGIDSKIALPAKVGAVFFSNQGKAE